MCMRTPRWPLERGPFSHSDPTRGGLTRLHSTPFTPLTASPSTDLLLTLRSGTRGKRTRGSPARDKGFPTQGAGRGPNLVLTGPAAPAVAAPSVGLPGSSAPVSTASRGLGPQTRAGPSARRPRPGASFPRSQRRGRLSLAAPWLPPGCPLPTGRTRQTSGLRRSRPLRTGLGGGGLSL